MKKQAGNILLLLSLLLIIFIYYPVFMAYLPSDQVLASGNQSTILIPKINAKAVIIEDVDSENQSEYQKALYQGVAQARSFAKPGEGKLVYLFAHSSLPPWEMTRTNTAFLRLNELQNGDQILITAPCYSQSVTLNDSEGYNSNGKLYPSATPQDDKQCTYKYAVVDKQEYWPNQVEVFDEKREENMLILQTCTPIGTDLKRLLVFAKPV